MGESSGPPIPRAAGAGAAARRTIPTRTTAAPAARAPAPARPFPRIFAPSPWARRRTARSSARRRPTESWASSRRSASSAARELFPSRTARTPRAPWGAPLPTRRRCSARWLALTRTIPPPKFRGARPRPTTPSFSTAPGCAERESASSARRTISARVSRASSPPRSTR